MYVGHINVQFLSLETDYGCLQVNTELASYQILQMSFTAMHL